MLTNDDWIKANEAISALYRAPLVDGGWGHAIGLVAAAVESGQGVFQILDHAEQNYAQFDCVGYDVSVYTPEFLHAVRMYDPWDAHVQRLPSRERVIIGSSLLSKSEIQRSGVVDEVMKPAGIEGRDAAALYVDLDGVEAMVAIYASKARNFFDAKQKEILDLLYPHIRRAATIHGQLHNLKEKLETSKKISSGLFWGALVLNRSGSIINHNDMADYLLSGADVFSVKGNKVHCVASDEDSWFQRALLNATNSPPDPSNFRAFSRALFGRDLKRPWTVTVAPFESKSLSLNYNFEDLNQFALVLISNHRPEISSRISHLARVFRLTKSEEKVVSGLVDGLPPSAIANETGRSVETIRFHLKNIYEKTSVGGQVELIRLVLTSPIVPDGEPYGEEKA